MLIMLGQYIFKEFLFQNEWMTIVVQFFSFKRSKTHRSFEEAAGVNGTYFS